MTLRNRVLSALFTAIVVAGAAHAANDPILIDGATSATLSWDAASGPVEGYYVIVARNGSVSTVYSFSNDTTETVTGEYGDTIVVQVAAYDASGLAGPVSLPSQAIAFSPPIGSGGSGSGGGTTPPPDDGSGGTPGASIARLDFSGDGVSDLLVRDAQAGELSLWTMDGSVAIASTQLPPLDLPWRVVGNADYDGNGVADILWQDGETDHVAIWSMAGGAVMSTALFDLAGLETEGRWTVEGSGDFDGDGAADVALLNRTLGIVEILRQDAAGTIAPWTRFEAYRGAWTVAATPDLDGDGIAEFIWSEESEKRLVVWTIDGNGIADAFYVSPPLKKGWRVIGSGDHDGDGIDDLVLRNLSSQQAEIWLMNGGSRAASIELPAGVDEAWYPIAGGGDYDADGNADLVWSNPDTGQITLWFTTPPTVVAEDLSGASLAAGEIVVSGAERANDSIFRQKLCSGDLNGDGFVGMPDLALFKNCLGQAGAGSCEAADMDSDGFVDENDFGLMTQVFGSTECADGV